LVTLRESGIVSVPLTMGMLKPIVLLPLGLLSNLPPDQVEAILLHELAHIRRKDYFVNLLQCFGESIFFFNPAVLWLSAQIRQEREHCCDDIAISVTGNKSTFIYALMAFQEQPVKTVIHAPAFPGKTYHLLDRIKRILYNNNKNLNNMEKIFLTSGVVLAGVLLLAFSSNKTLDAVNMNKAQTEKNIIIPGAAIPGSVKDTVPEQLKKKKPVLTGTITQTVDGNEYRIELKDDVIAGLYVNNKRIPNDKITDYKNVTDQVIEQTREKAAKDKENADNSKELVEKDKQLSEVNARLAELESQLARERMQTDLLRKQSKMNEELIHLQKIGETDHKNAVERKQAEELNMQLRKMEYSDKLSKQQQEKNKELELVSKKLAELDKKSFDYDISHEHEIAVEQHKKIVEERQKEIGDMKKKISESAMIREKERKMEYETAREYSLLDKKRAEEIRKGMIKDLLEDKIISDPDHVSIQLSNESLIVNGEKQPEAIFKKFKDKYGVKEGRQFNYNQSNNKNSSNNKTNTNRSSNIRVD
jgi:hypothetical protein